MTAKFGSLEIVKYLVEHGAEVNGKDKCGKTVLHSAAVRRSLEIVKYLVEHGAEVNGKDKLGETVLHSAAQRRSLEIVKYLVEHGAEVNSKDEQGKTFLHSATEWGSLEIVKYLVEHGAEVNGKDIFDETVLHDAVRCGSLEIIKYLVEHGAEVNGEDWFGNSALPNAVRCGSLEIVKYLVEHGAEVNSDDWLGNSALHIAVGCGSLEIVKYLVEHGAEVNEVRTLIECSKNLGHYEVTNILKLVLKKSVKHREKIQMLKTMNYNQLKKQMELPIHFVPKRDFKIGSGTNGTCVYVGVMEDGSEVAVKRMITQAGEDTAENENEKEILDLIRTEEFPFIVSYRHFLRDDTFTYLIVDLCEENLKQHVDSQSIDYLQRHGPRMIEEILRGLTFLHDQGILHRDLKPLNILVDIEGHMRLADFGISRLLSENETTVETDPKGTKYWMPAEAVESIKSRRKCRFKKKSDIQVSGMIAFFILTKGEHPFGSSLDRMANILKGNPVNLYRLNDRRARQFISWLISHKINDRPYAHEALKHSFMNKSSNNFDRSVSEDAVKRKRSRCKE